MGDMADWLADNAAAMGEDDLDAWSDERGAPYPFRQVGRTMDDAMEEVDGVRCIAETPKAIRVMLPAPPA